MTNQKDLTKKEFELDFEIQGEFKFTEPKKIEYLKPLIDRFEELKDKIGNMKDCKNGYVEMTEKQTLDILTKVYNNSIKKKGKNEIIFKYSRYSPTGEGRLFSTTPSLQGLKRRIRHLLSEDYLYDLDISNCHPKILEWYCKSRNIDCPFLSKNIKERQDWFNKLKEIYCVDRDSIKTSLLKMMNGGGNDFDMTKAPDFLLGFSGEVKSIHEKIMGLEENKSLVMKIKKRKEKLQFQNIGGSVMNHLLCFYENRILQMILYFCSQKNIKVGSLCFDGCMIHKDSINNLKDFLLNLNEYIYNKTSINCEIVSKDMTEGHELKELVKNYVEKIKDEDEIDESIPPFGDINDETMGIHLLKKFEDEKLVYYSKKLDKLYIYDEKKRLYVESKKKNLNNFIPDEFRPILHNELKRYKSEEKNTKKINALLDNISSFRYCSGITDWIMTKIEDSSEFIETHFDRNEKLFPFQNKVFDFEKGMDRDRLREDYFTVSTSNHYKNKYDDLKVKKYIGEILNTKDKAYIDCFLTILASGLTGITSLKKIFVLIGKGNNGKSAFMTLYKSIIDEFETTCAKKAIIKSKSESSHQAEYFSMINKRVATTSELNENEEFNETFLKNVSGNDGKMNVRDCGGKAVSVYIEPKIFINTNDLPKLVDPVFKKRLIIINFSNYFETSDEKGKEIQALKEDLFPCLCHYATLLFKNKCKIDYVSQVIASTNEEIDKRDSLKQFINENIEITEDKNDKISRPDFYKRYVQYCKENSETGIGKIKVFDSLKNIYKIESYRDRDFIKIKFREEEITQNGNYTFEM